MLPSHSVECSLAMTDSFCNKTMHLAGTAVSDNIGIIEIFCKIIGDGQQEESTFKID